MNATEARKRWAYAHEALNADHEDAKLATSRDILAIRLKAEADQAENLAYWAREYARLVEPA